MTKREIKDTLKGIKGELKIVFKPPLISAEATFTRVLNIHFSSCVSRITYSSDPAQSHVVYSSDHLFFTQPFIIHKVEK